MPRSCHPLPSEVLMPCLTSVACPYAFADLVSRFAHAILADALNTIAEWSQAGSCHRRAGMFHLSQTDRQLRLCGTASRSAPALQLLSASSRKDRAGCGCASTLSRAFAHACTLYAYVHVQQPRAIARVHSETRGRTVRLEPHAGLVRYLAHSSGPISTSQASRLGLQPGPGPSADAGSATHQQCQVLPLVGHPATTYTLTRRMHRCSLLCWVDLTLQPGRSSTCTCPEAARSAPGSPPCTIPLPSADLASAEMVLHSIIAARNPKTTHFSLFIFWRRASPLACSPASCSFSSSACSCNLVARLRLMLRK